ncbi:MAG TPA: hypothetical protein VGP47_09610 [Parachlamydiaceae bacterium]|nr:hypothetical protein [Parachlamydiaceae bacterium]
MGFLIVKRHVSLVEVLIAVTLTVAILMTLTFFYRQVTEIGYEVDRTSAKNFNMRHLETRLAQIIPKAVGEKHKNKDFLFFSVNDEGVTKPGSQSLIFTFDNLVSLDKPFSGHVLARLYLDANSNLLLAYWPSPKRWENNTAPSMKRELLLQGVENLAFEFYIAPKRKDREKQELENEASPAGKNSKDKEKDAKSTEKPKDIEPEPKGEWRRQNWLEDYKQLPVMVKIIVTMPKEPKPLVFIYPLANARTHVIYE